MTSPSARAAIKHLASIDRSSCSSGEHDAAAWIAARLGESCSSVDIETERVHGTYWWPLGLTSALGLAGAIAAGRGRRAGAAAVGALGAALALDDVGAGWRWLRRVLPKQATANVVARTGDPDAERTLVVLAHHDAAHTGIFFDPRIAEFIGRRLQPAPGEPPRGLAPMTPVVAAPATVALAALAGWRRLTRLAGLVCGGIIASFAHIALSPTVPGANDNLTGVATLLALAEALEERPVEGLKVLLVSTGAEESLMEGMRAFAARHFSALNRDRTYVLCVDTVGSPHLLLAEEEGMLQVRRYDPGFTALVASCAADAGVALRAGVSMRLGTDGYLALRYDVPAALLISVDDYGGASNYHWPTDTPERVDYASLDGAVAICESVIRRLAAPSVG
jgi:hypothetical protein